MSPATLIGATRIWGEQWTEIRQEHLRRRASMVLHGGMCDGLLLSWSERVVEGSVTSSDPPTLPNGTRIQASISRQSSTDRQTQVERSCMRLQALVASLEAELCLLRCMPHF